MLKPDVLKNPKDEEIAESYERRYRFLTFPAKNLSKGKRFFTPNFSICRLSFDCSLNPFWLFIWAVGTLVKLCTLCVKSSLRKRRNVAWQRNLKHIYVMVFCRDLGSKLVIFIAELTAIWSNLYWLQAIFTAIRKTVALAVAISVAIFVAILTTISSTSSLLVFFVCLLFLRP